MGRRYCPGVDDLADLREQNKILRDRIQQLERATAGQIDPVLEALIQHAPAFLNVITPEGRFLATARPSAGFGSVIGRSVFDFVEPDQHAVMRDAYARACTTRQPVTYETVGYSEDGEPGHTYLVRVVPLIENDAVGAIALIPTDITQRVKLERSLAQSEEKLRLAVGATRMGLWSWDIERNLVLWDDRCLEIFGVREPPGDYELYLALIHPDDRKLVRDTIRSAIETSVYQPFEHRLVPRGDGLERWVLGTGTVLKNGAGKTLLMGGCLDITEQKSVAAQLQRAQRVETLGQLTAGLAHNFNNLLGAIIPNLELALEQASSEQTEPLAAAIAASLQARDLIKRLMALTVRRGNGSPNSCDPRDVVERTVAICQATFPREIQLTFTVEPGVGPVAMETSDLDQVVLNLLFNARDALEHTRGHDRLIEVKLDRVSGPGGARQVRLRVRDTGAGMSAAVQARMFEPFFSTKSAHRGSGLGLADALSRVRAAGGKLECLSAEGAGTTFTLLLPEGRHVTSTSPPAGQPRAGSPSETILIVDDEPAVRGAVARQLVLNGYRVLEAAGADEARVVLSANRQAVRLVLLDQSMPQESGLEALPSLRRLSDAPVVMFTGGAGELPPGAAALLEKPATASELLRTIRFLLEPASAR
jgi:PAS domain S-box-containing protein